MEKELKILMLEDMEEDAGLVDRVLRKDKIPFSRFRVDTKDEFTAALESFRPDVILSDHSLPQFNSIEAFKICQGMKLEVPFILVTGAVSEEFAVSCLKSGVDDYVLKSNLSRLPLAIRFALRNHQLERNRKEQEDMLRMQNEELKKLNRELDLFVYSSSHNLRAPLRSVLGLVNLSRNEVKERNLEVLPQCLDMMETSINRLDETVEHILEYSKTARLDNDVVEIDFNITLKEILDNFEFIDSHKKIEKITAVHDGPILSCSKMRLNWILLNLVLNAIKYYDPAKARPFVKVEVFQEPGRARIIVEDNGIGIPEHHQGRVFDMFYRATEKSEGSGLGLYIVKEALERMNGVVELQSKEGRGTTFTITVPTSGKK